MSNDLISRKALIAAIKTNSPTFYDGQDIADWQAKCINEAPAVDAEPVRHGEWGDYQINGYDGLHPTYEVPCLLCNEYARFKYRFCPHCGARMDGGNDDERSESAMAGGILPRLRQAAQQLGRACE